MATATPIAPKATTTPPPVNPTTTGPTKPSPDTTGPTKPKPATKPAPQNPAHPHGTNKDGTPSKRRGRPRKIGEGVEDKSGETRKPSSAGVVVAKKPADITSKASAGSLFDYPAVPVFGRETSPADRIAKLTAWQKATHQGYDPNVSDAQTLTKIKGDKMLKVAKEEQYNLRYKPLSTIPNTLAEAQAALVKTKATEPRNNARKSKDQQSPTWRRWNRQKEDLEDKIKALTKSAAVKPIEKAGKEGKSTDLVDAVATGGRKPMKPVGYKVKASDYPNLQPTDRVFLNNQYNAWAGANKDIAKLKLRKVINPSDTKITKRMDALNAVIRRAKKRIVTIEKRGGGRR